MRLRTAIALVLLALIPVKATPQSPLERLKRNIPASNDKSADKKDTTKSSDGSKQSYLELARQKYRIAVKFPSPNNWPRFYNKKEVEPFLTIAQELDFPNTKTRLDEGIRRFPELAREYDIKRLTENFAAEFRQLAEHLVSESNRFIEIAYQNQSSNKLQASEHAEGAVMIADTVLLVLPDHNGALAVKKDAEAAVNKFGGAIASSSGSGSLHRANAGKIVFFRSPQNVGQEDSGAIASRFKGGDYIYGVAYLKSSLKDFTHLPNRDWLKNIHYRLFIDGQEHRDYGGFPAGITWEEYQNPGTNHLKVDIVVDPAATRYDSPSRYDPAIKYAKIFGQSSPRKHKIELKLIAEYNAIAEGSFELDLSEGQEKLLALTERLHQEKISRVFLPKPKMVNAALQQSIVAALKANGWKQQILRVAITDSDWHIHRNALGAIEFRSLGASVAMKEPDGRCRYFTLSFKQPFLGGGRYGSTAQYGVGNNFEMLCANVGK